MDSEASNYEAELAEHNRKEAEWKRKKTEHFERIKNPGEMAIEVASAINLLADAIEEQNRMLNIVAARVARMDRDIKHLETDR